MNEQNIGDAALIAPSLFPLDHDSGNTEAAKTYKLRAQSGFFSKYFSGERVLDIGPKGGSNPDGKTVVPRAIGIDLDYPGYDGVRLPFADSSVDTVFSSHCIEHIWFVHQAIRDHFRVLKIGGYIVTVVPHQFLYERKRFLPSLNNPDHKRMFTPASLMALYEEALEPNTYRVRHLRDNDLWYDYSKLPPEHPYGCYEIELVIEKIQKPSWDLLE